MNEFPPVIDGMYVAFCDILGFSDLTTSHFDQTLKLYGDFGDFLLNFPYQMSNLQFILIQSS
jgi:hypothetical protein